MGKVIPLRPCESCGGRVTQRGEYLCYNCWSEEHDEVFGEVPEGGFNFVILFLAFLLFMYTMKVMLTPDEPPTAPVAPPAMTTGLW